MKSFNQKQVADWARTKPSDGAYSFGNLDNCALAQFLREAGHALSPEVGGFTWNDDAGKCHDIPEPLGTLLVRRPWTFGALADRLS